MRSDRILSESHQGRRVETIRLQILIIQRRHQPRDGLIQSYTASQGRDGTTPQTLGALLFSLSSKPYSSNDGHNSNNNNNFRTTFLNVYHRAGTVLSPHKTTP